jgi:hypothetical protein
VKVGQNQALHDAVATFGAAAVVYLPAVLLAQQDERGARADEFRHGEDDARWLPVAAPFGVRLFFLAGVRAVFDRPLNHSVPFRLPSNQRKVDFAAEFECVETVRKLKFGTSMADLA